VSLRHFLIPSEHNDFSPRVLQKTASLLMAGLVLLTFVITNLQTVLWQSSDRLVGSVLPAVVVDATNAARQKEKVPTLVRSVKLDEAATYKARHMATAGYFAHFSPDGVSPWYWFALVEYPYARAGENIAIHFSDSKAVVAAWLDSPAHRANILDSDFLEIGVGTAEGMYRGKKTVFVVQLFATPAAPLQPMRVTTEVLQGGVMTEELVSPVADTDVAGGESGMIGQSYISTTSGLVALPHETHESSAVVAVAGTSVASVLATTPNTILRGLYLGLGGVVASLLVLSVLLSWRRTEPLRVAYGVLLLCLMTGLFYLHSLLTTSVVIAASA
jgi:uncharacterized protein YkwD